MQRDGDTAPSQRERAQGFGVAWGGLSWGAGQDGEVGTEGQRRERVPSAWGEPSPPAHRGQGPATHPGVAVTTWVTTGGAGRGEMLGTAGSSSVGTAPPQPVGPGDQHWVPVGLPPPALAVPWLLPATSPLAAPNPRCVFHLPTSALGGPGRSQRGEHWWDPTKDGAGQRLHFWGGRMGGKQEVPQGRHPPAAGAPQLWPPAVTTGPGLPQPRLLREPPQEAVAQRRHGKTMSRGASSNVARARAGSGTLAAPGDVLSLPLLGGHAAQERVALWKASRTWKPHETVEAKDRFSDTDHLRRESSRGRRISEKRRGRGRGEESKKQRNEAKEKERKAGGTRPSE